MSEADRQKWQRRYAAGEYEERTHPTRMLEEWLPALPRPQGARALDLACGAGRNALFLAAQGYRVDAMDISSIALERAAASASKSGLKVDWIEVDLDDAALTTQRYDLVVVSRYVNRALSGDIAAALRDGGYLLYEQHLRTSREVGGPGSAQFRVAPNELLRMFPALRVLYYREAIIDDPDGATMALAQMVACKGSPGF
jgi:SAM-dependent methyltransferase